MAAASAVIGGTARRLVSRTLVVSDTGTSRVIPFAKAISVHRTTMYSGNQKETAEPVAGESKEKRPVPTTTRIRPVEDLRGESRRPLRKNVAAVVESR